MTSTVFKTRIPAGPGAVEPGLLGHLADFQTPVHHGQDADALHLRLIGKPVRRILQLPQQLPDDFPYTSSIDMETL